MNKALTQAASSWRLSGAVPVMAEQCQARGVRAAVAAAAPTAALIAAEMLRAGGNAYDAAVAAALAETVLLPPKCGLAGDLIALCWHRGEKLPQALLAIGRAPVGLANLARQGKLQPTGPASVGIPGAPDGYLALAARGRLPLDRLVRPAIELAENGFCWSRICSVLSEESAELVLRHNPHGSCYYPGGRTIVPGAVVRLPGLSAVLQAFLRDRRDFLRGEVGAAIIECVSQRGGILSNSDFAAGTEAEWTEVAVGSLASSPLFVTPAPTHGPALLMATQPIADPGELPAATIHKHIMAAIAWSEQALADHSGTSMVSAVDADGTMVTIVHSNSYPRFGSGLIVRKFDLILANRAGRGFSSDPRHPNFPHAGRRPATTLHAWATRCPGGVRIQGATPGGANQMLWNAQTLARLAAGETDIGQLVAAPRWEWLPADNALRVEAGFTNHELAFLKAAAPRIELTGRWGSASAMQIISDDVELRRLAAAADPRTVGSALAY